MQETGNEISFGDPLPRGVGSSRPEMIVRVRVMGDLMGSESHQDQDGDDGENGDDDVNEI